MVKGARHSRPPGPNAIVLPQNLAKYSRLDSIIVYTESEYTQVASRGAK